MPKAKLEINRDTGHGIEPHAAQGDGGAPRHDRLDVIRGVPGNGCAR